jgi:hypothetical protein
MGTGASIVNDIPRNIETLSCLAPRTLDAGNWSFLSGTLSFANNGPPPSELQTVAARSFGSEDDWADNWEKRQLAAYRGLAFLKHVERWQRANGATVGVSPFSNPRPLGSDGRNAGPLSTDGGK